MWHRTGPSVTAADLGVTLVELLAYVADHLSYQQDAVATEAYLGTARSRISLRRHARLVDYIVDDGENARVWLYIGATAEDVPLPLGTLVLPRLAGVTPSVNPSSPTAQTMLAQNGVVFATLAAASLSQSLNQISFYTWSDTNCCLPAGATAATLAGHLDGLSAGDVLLFEEIAGPLTGAPEDANPLIRWIVRLTGVTTQDRFGNLLIDPANSDPNTNAITLITWAPPTRCRSRFASPRLPIRRTATRRSPTSASRAATWCRPITDCGTTSPPSAPSRPRRPPPSAAATAPVAPASTPPPRRHRRPISIRRCPRPR